MCCVSWYSANDKYVICQRVLKLYHGVRKICRLSWLTNSALVFEPKCGGGVAGSKPMSIAVHRKPNKLSRFNSIFNIWQPRSLPSDKCCQQTVWIHAAICRIFPELSASWWGWRGSSWAPRPAPVCLWPQEDCWGSWAQPPPLQPCIKTDYFYTALKKNIFKNSELSNH